MYTASPFILILAAALVLITGWSAIPLIQLALAPGLLKYWFLDAPQSDKLISGSTAVQSALQQLQSLGFELLGIKVEKQPWHQPLYEIATVSADRDAFGSIMLSPEKKVMGHYLYTPLSGGGLVFTRGHSSLPDVENDTTSVKSVLSNNLSEMWTSHRQRLEVFRQKGLTPMVANSQESRLAATKTYYETDYARRTARAFLRGPTVQAFVLMLIFLLALVLITFYQFNRK